MGTPKLIRKSQILGKVEQTPGTAETLTASEGECRIIVGAGFEPDLPTEPRNIARSSLTNIGSIPGQKAGTVSFRTEINTPDTITADSEFGDFLQGCGLTISTLSVITIGAISSGPYQRGETVTGSVTGDTGRVLKETANGETSLYIEILTGTFDDDDENIVGASGASATASTVASDAGHIVKPVSDNQKTCTVEYQEGGYAWSVKGAMSNLVATLEASKPGYFDFNFTGPKNNFGDKALTTGITRDTEEPPILQCAEATIDSTTIVFSTITFDMGNNVVHRIDGNSCDTGIIADFISSREPKLTISFEHLPESTLDIFGDLDDASKVPIQFTLGQTAGKIFRFFADNAQVTNIGMGDADGIRTLDVEFTLCGDAGDSDDEFEFTLQ